MDLNKLIDALKKRAGQAATQVKSTVNQASKAVQPFAKSYVDTYQKVSPYIPLAPKIYSPQSTQRNYNTFVKPVVESVKKTPLSSVTPFSQPLSRLPVKQPTFSDVGRVLRTFATDQFKSNIYNPDTRELFPNALPRKTARLAKYKFGTPEYISELKNLSMDTASNFTPNLVAGTIKPMTVIPKSTIKIHGADKNIMAMFASEVERAGAKGNRIDMGQLGLDAQRIVEKYFGKKFATATNKQIQQLFDYALAKREGGLVIKPHGIEIPVGLQAKEAKGLAQQALEKEVKGNYTPINIKDGKVAKMTASESLEKLLKSSSKEGTSVMQERVQSMEKDPFLKGLQEDGMLSPKQYQKKYPAPIAKTPVAKPIFKKNAPPPDEFIRDLEKNAPPDVKDKINLVDEFLRTPDRVMKKMGLTKEMDALRVADEQYRKDLPKEIDRITAWSKRVSPEGNVKIFKYLDGQPVSLDSNEMKVATEVKQYLREWADKLNLPNEKRITNYITHIFDDGAGGMEFSDEIAKLIQDKVAGSVYDPFVLKRLGKRGYIEDTWQSLDAYVKRATRKVNMDPALRDIKFAAEKLEKSQFDYVKEYIDRVNMRPTKWDERLDTTIKQLVGYKYGQRPVTALSQRARKWVYRATLGLNPGSAIKNLTQGANTYSKLGEKYTLIGYTKALKNLAGGSDELTREGILGNEIIQDRTINATKKFWEKFDKGLFVFFEAAEKINRGSAYFGAKAKGLAEGMNEQQAIDYAKKIVRDTQFSFGSIDTPPILASDIGKTLLQFQSYSLKQGEFMAEMLASRDVAGMLRWALGSFLMVNTIGSAIGMNYEDLIPAFRIGLPPTLKLPTEIGKAALNVPDKYGNISDEKNPFMRVAKSKDVQRSLPLLLPAGVQIKKTYEGLRDTTRGYSESAKGRIQYAIDPSLKNKIKAGIFGKNSLKENQNYFDNEDSVLGEKQSEMLKKSSDKVGTYKLLMNEREVNKRKQEIKAKKDEALELFLKGDKAAAKKIKEQYKLKIKKSDLKSYVSKKKQEAFESYLNGDKATAKAMKEKYKFKMLKSEIEDYAKRYVIRLYKDGLEFDNKVLIEEASKLKRKYGLKITKKDVGIK